MEANRPIGVLDTGVGGLTVVRELQKLLPGEDIIFFGDSANCPYGNRSSEEIVELSRRMFDFLGDHCVKATAIACNTISSLKDVLQPMANHHIISIIEAAADYIAREKLDDIGLIATEFTVHSGCYDKLIHEKDPHCRVTGKGSPLLAHLVDRGDFDQEAIDHEIKTEVDDILARAPIRHLVLGCTHYPIVADNFRKLYPSLHLIDPAREQALAMKRFLEENDAINPQKQGSFRLCTSGDPQNFIKVSEMLGITKPTEIQVIQLS